MTMISSSSSFPSPSSNLQRFCSWTTTTVIGTILSIIVALISSSSSSPPSPSIFFVDAIVGGTIVHHPSKQYPGFVWTGIRPDLKWGCGGALIHPDVVLTAAHCQWVYNFDETVFINPQSITGGGKSMADGGGDDDNATTSSSESEVEIRTVQSRLIHPKFIDPAQDHSQLMGSYDVMLVKLNKPVSSNIEPFKYNLDPSFPPPPPPVENTTGDDDKDNSSLITIIGFGTVSEDETDGPKFSTSLREVTVIEFDYDACNATYAKPPSETNDGGSVDPLTQLCSGTVEGGKDACGSDSGCPMLVPIRTTVDSSTDNDEATVAAAATTTTTQMVVVGIVDDGIGCGRPSVPSINARVSGYADWIQSSICKLSDSPPPSCQKKGGHVTNNNNNNNKKSGSSSKTTMFGISVLVILVLIAAVVLFRRFNLRRSDGYDSIP